ncbi:MAG TPA: adaptor protein MecA [Bacillales bacterium]|nr:adaptor protein MecA [Bacillales bacterium]
MKIERVNENTLKFFITYMDMEKRGFDREEIWYNRERGEELFWEMMDEAHDEEEFSLEGPLWIQVQALEKGLEIIVTRAQLSKDGSKLELPINDDKQIDIPIDEQMESFMEQTSYVKRRRFKHVPEPVNDGELSFLIGFQDFEDIIQLSHIFNDENVLASLYNYEDRYYLYVVFEDEEEDKEDKEDDRRQEDQLSILLEYGFETELTIHMLEEYGNAILQENALKELRSHFSLRPS